MLGRHALAGRMLVTASAGNTSVKRRGRGDYLERFGDEK
jgi:hypothetical protein